MKVDKETLFEGVQIPKSPTNPVKKSVKKVDEKTRKLAKEKMAYKIILILVKASSTYVDIPLLLNNLWVKFLKT